jgi:soluble lytic murein transglycosylase
MKKLLIVLLVIGIVTQACYLIGQSSVSTLASPTAPAVSTITPFPSAMPTSAPTIVPTFTPTPVPEVRVASGDHAMFNGDYDTALSEYSAALAGSADPAIQEAAMLGQGHIHYLTGDYPNALNEFREITDRYPGTTQAADAYSFINERRGDAFTANGDYSSALAAYISAVQSPRLPTNFAMELKLAQTYTVLGEYATSGVVYDDIYNRTSSSDIKAQVDYARGQMYAAMNQAEQATASYVDAVYNYPHAYYSYLSLVELVDAGYPVSDLQRGLVDYNARQYGVALTAFDRYITLNPSDASTALYFKGLILRDQGDLPSAISLWDNVIQGDSTSSVWDSAWEDKAYTQWAYQDDFTGAEKTLLDFVAASPTHTRAAEFLFDAARVAERDNRLEDAAKLWQRIPTEYPNSEYVFRAMFLAAISHYRLGDYAAAQTAFWQAKDFATTPADRAGAYFWVGKSQAEQGDATSAQTSWQQTASIDPTGYYSERSRDLLNNITPFTPPMTIDLGIDHQSELKQADLWMLTTFNYPTDTDMSVPGPIASDPRFIRGQEFWRLGLYDQAEAEFNNMREEAAADPLTTYRLAVFLSDLGMYRQAILAARQVLDLAGLDDAGTLTAPVLFSHIRFGAYYPDLVAPVAEGNNFSPLFIWSTIRQESLFDPSIQSSAGAFGLMQVLPVTGEDIVSRLGWPANYTQADLLRPDVNLTLGQDYLADQRDNLGGDLYAALAAYNGGPGNAAAWQSLAKGDPDLFVEVVRFDETRNYLMGIYEVFSIYSRLYARVP